MPWPISLTPSIHGFPTTKANASLFQQSVLAKRGTDFPIQVNGKFVEIRHIKGTLSSSQPPPSPVALLLGSEYQMQDVVLLAVACQAR